MTRAIPMLTVLLLALSSAVAPAEDIRCRVQGGPLVLTDQPEAVPPDCQKVPPPAEGGSLSVVPTPPPDTAATEQYLQEASREAAARRLQLQQWQGEAQALADDYRQALADIRGASYTVDTLAIGQRITLIKQRKAELLGALAAAGASEGEAAPIVQPLATIPP
jgi:hypothetical protein